MGNDVVGTLHGLAQLAQYRIKEKRKKVEARKGNGRPVFNDDACKLERAEYMRDQAFGSARRVKELLNIAHLHLLHPTTETAGALRRHIVECTRET